MLVRALSWGAVAKRREAGPHLPKRQNGRYEGERVALIIGGGDGEHRSIGAYRHEDGNVSDPPGLMGLEARSVRGNLPHKECATLLDNEYKFLDKQGYICHIATKTQLLDVVRIVYVKQRSDQQDTKRWVTA